MTKLEESVQNLLAYKFITSITGAISDRAKRKYDKIGKYVADNFKEKKFLPENSYLSAELKWSDEAANWARKMTLGIEEFKQAYPEYGKILNNMIENHREIRRAYLEFGVKGGELNEKVYVNAIKELDKNITDQEAKQFYRIIKKLNNSLKKKNKGLQKLLLPE